MRDHRSRLGPPGPFGPRRGLAPPEKPPPERRPPNPWRRSPSRDFQPPGFLNPGLACGFAPQLPLLGAAGLRGLGPDAAFRPIRFLVWRFPPLSFLEARSLLISCELVFRARVDVVAARPPRRRPIGWRPATGFQRFERRDRRVPQLSTVEVAQRHRRLRALKLLQRRHERLAVLRAERRRGRPVHDDPERVAAGHD